MMSAEAADPREREAAAVRPIIINSMLFEHREGRDPLCDYDTASTCLEALGRGHWSPSAIRDLVVVTWIHHGRTVAPLSRWLKAADAMNERRARRPNLKAKAAATARASRKPRAAAG